MTKEKQWTLPLEASTIRIPCGIAQYGSLYSLLSGTGKKLFLTLLHFVTLFTKKE